MNGVIFMEILRRSWRQILYWGIGLGLYAIFPFLIIPDQAGLEGYAEVTDTLDPALLRAFGIGDGTSLGTPEGFVGYSFFGFALLILSVFAVIAGLNVSANEEEAGIMDMVLSLPVPRWVVIVEKLLAYTTMIIGILLLSLAGLLVGNALAAPDMQLETSILIEGIINVLPGTLFVLVFTAFVGTLMRRRATAMAIAGVFVVGSYLLDSIGRAANAEVTDALRQLSIFAHYDGSNVLSQGMAVGAALVIVVLAVVLSGATMQLFQRRDIAV